MALDVDMNTSFLDGLYKTKQQTGTSLHLEACSYIGKHYIAA
jgi:hypothetical protein